MAKPSYKRSNKKLESGSSKLREGSTRTPKQKKMLRGRKKARQMAIDHKIAYDLGVKGVTKPKATIVKGGKVGYDQDQDYDTLKRKKAKHLKEINYKSKGISKEKMKKLETKMNRKWSGKAGTPQKTYNKPGYKEGK